MITLIAGYKRTGKDTLVKMFNQEQPFNWLVYSNGGDKFDPQPANRIGFADKLREEVDNILGINTENLDYDEFKETIVKDGKTYRDFLIEHAAVRRNENIDYWVSIAFDWKSLTNDNICITDWRYPNELEYLKQFDNLTVRTIRLYRSEVPIPPPEVISEHQLDDLLTDYLLVTSEDEFEKACSVFPQYKSYR